jgi:hypothetical protein
MFAGPAGDDDEAAAIPLELESSVEGEGLVAAKIEMLFYWRGITRNSTTPSHDARNGQRMFA